MAVCRIIFGIALLVLLSASGCATRGRSSIAPRVEGGGLPPLPLKTTADVVDEINRNAEPVQSLEAMASITVTAGEKKYPVDGQFSLQRPRDFKLSVSSSMGKEANIGSNDQRFWIWTKQSKEKEIIVCDYDADGKAPLAMGIQPEWIVEALGLRVIPESEIAQLKLTRGSGAYEGTYVLTQRLRGSDGLEYVKSTYLSQTTNAVIEHRMDAIKNGQVSPMTRATISGYGTYPMVDGSGSQSVKLPNKFKLTWYAPGKMEMDVVVTSAAPNKRIDPARFEEPNYRGYTRRQINDRAGMASESTVRETRPAPPVGGGGGMRLGVPQPLEEPAQTKPSSRGQAPLSFGPDLGGSVAPGGQVIGPRVPTAPVQEGLAVPAGNGRRPSLSIEQ